jgi:dolichol kinase
MNVTIAKELLRRIAHIILLILIIYFILAYNKQIALMVLVALLIIVLAVEYLRIELGWKTIFSAYVSTKEFSKMHSSIYFLISAVISLAIFESKIAIAALIMAVFGGMAAVIIGKKYGTALIYRNKTWAGFIAGLVVNFIIAISVLIASYNIYVIIGMALTATFVDTFVDEMEDNLLVPICAGFVGQIIRFAF